MKLSSSVKLTHIHRFNWVPGRQRENPRDHRMHKNVMAAAIVAYLDIELPGNRQGNGQSGGT